MATSKRRTETTIVVKEVREETEFVDLTLTLEEAETLHFVSRHIGGDPDGPRGHMDNIYKALRATEVRRREFPLSKEYKGASALYFQLIDERD